MNSGRLELQPLRLLPAVLASATDDAGGGPRSRRDRIIDAAFCLAALVAGAAIFGGEVRHDDLPQWQQVAGVVAGLVACAALWLRRRWPVGVAIVVLVLAGISSFAGVAGLLGFFTVAAHRRFAVLAAVTGVGLLTLALSLTFLSEPGESSDVLSLALLTIVNHVAVGAWGMYLRARRLLVHSLQERADRAESEQQLHVEQARHHERTQIAREMHDVLAHRISLLSMHAGALELRPEAPPAEIERAAGVVRASAHQALEDLREVIGVLRADEADGGLERPQPALANLPSLLDESRAAGMHVSSECRIEDLTAVPERVGRNAYRILQEGLTNARKHAHGAAVDVTLEGAAGEGITVEVRNRLPLTDPGPTQIPGTGTGLIGLAERTGLAGGRLEHGRTPDDDFRLAAWLPWPA